MARKVNRLTARSVATIKTPGRHADGDGLYLVVDKSGARRWVFLFRREGRLKEMGLGGAGRVGLAQARKLAIEVRKQLAAGLNPIEERRRVSAADEVAKTFGPFAASLVPEICAGFRNEKHRAQWASTLATYASSLNDKPLDEIETDDVLRILQPIWMSKSETASRLRGRIERILDAARAKGLRSGENPARWRGHLDALLPRPNKLSRGHHAAIPFERAPQFMARLQGIDAISARALEFCILTATRSGETLQAAWFEIDLHAAVWTVPAERMKAGRAHRVPLSTSALSLLESLSVNRIGDLVFPGQRRGRPLSNMAMAMILRRLEPNGATVHGFRSAFRDWAAEMSDHPREVAEAALAHTVGDQTERAYRRRDALEKRRALMEEWAQYCFKGGQQWESRPNIYRPERLSQRNGSRTWERPSD